MQELRTRLGGFIIFLVLDSCLASVQFSSIIRALPTYYCSIRELKGGVLDVLNGRRYNG